ncbi:hypothetical protein QT972_32110 [Microcoleus sp. herbarium7]|uniref:hypothetical protein n=1 Tax=Microcoleus sp. herbarium7 TaxID=3055435 RepID=UPI002FCFAF6D
MAQKLRQSSKRRVRRSAPYTKSGLDIPFISGRVRRSLNSRHQRPLFVATHPTPRPNKCKLTAILVNRSLSKVLKAVRIAIPQ